MARGRTRTTTAKRSASPTVAPGQVAGFDVLRAHRYELVDRKGEIRGGFGFADDGSPMLALMDPGEPTRIRAQLSLDQEGPALCLSDRKGRHAVTIVVKDAGPAVAIHDAEGRPRLLLGLTAEGRVVTTVYDKRGDEIRLVKRRFQAPTPDALLTRIRQLVDAGKKQEFMAAMEDLLDVQDPADLEVLWQSALDKVAGERGQTRGARRSRGPSRRRKGGSS